LPPCKCPRNEGDEGNAPCDPDTFFRPSFNPPGEASADATDGKDTVDPHAKDDNDSDAADEGEEEEEEDDDDTTDAGKDNDDPVLISNSGGIPAGDVLLFLAFFFGNCGDFFWGSD